MRFVFPSLHLNDSEDAIFDLTLRIAIEYRFTMNRLKAWSIPILVLLLAGCGGTGKTDAELKADAEQFLHSTVMGVLSDWNAEKVSKIRSGRAFKKWPTAYGGEVEVKLNELASVPIKTRDELREQRNQHDDIKKKYHYDPPGITYANFEYSMNYGREMIGPIQSIETIDLQPMKGGANLYEALMTAKFQKQPAYVYAGAVYSRVGSDIGPYKWQLTDLYVTAEPTLLQQRIQSLKPNSKFNGVSLPKL